jgi:hypothetical protein
VQNTFTEEERESGKVGYFMTNCPVVSQNQTKYNSHTKKLHKLQAEEFHIDKIEAIPNIEVSAGADGINKVLLDSLLASNTYQNYGKHRPRKISEKPSTKEAIRLVAEWCLYWQRCHLIDKDGTCPILHYNEVMSELRDHGLSQEQYENVQNYDKPRGTSNFKR